MATEHGVLASIASANDGLIAAARMPARTNRSMIAPRDRCWASCAPQRMARPIVMAVAALPDPALMAQVAGSERVDWVQAETSCFFPPQCKWPIGSVEPANKHRRRITSCARTPVDHCGWMRESIGGTGKGLIQPIRDLSET